ncbi:MAG: hypothetical protein HRT52_08300 [Colwellia sp.]|nr:hypothetical protein [Colwellia sp.]
MLPLLITFSHHCFAIQPVSLAHLTNVSDIKQDNQGFIWFSGQQGLTRYDGNDLVSFSSNSQKWSAPYSWVHKISLVDNQLLLSTENNGMVIFDPESETDYFLDTNLNNKTIYDAEFFQKEYYFHTRPEKNFYRYDPNTKQTHLIKSNTNRTSFMKNANQLFFYNRSGIYSINDKVTPIIKSPIEKALILDNHIVIANKNNLSVYEGNEKKHSVNLPFNITALAPTYNTNNFFSIDNQGVLRKYDTQLKELKHEYPRIKHKQIRKMFHDNSDTLWLINSQGVHKLSTNTIKNHDYVFDTVINAIDVEVFNKQLLIGSYGTGLHSFNSEINHWKKINSSLSRKGLIIFDLLAIDDELYIATFDGVWRYQLSLDKLEKLDFKNNNKIILKLIKSNNQLYIATDENGFLIYDLNQQRITDTIDESYDFSSTEIIDILPLKSNSLWLATAQGVDVYNLSSQKIEKIDIPGSTKVISLTSLNEKIFVATKGDGIFVFNQKKELLSKIAVGIDFHYIRAINNEIWAPSQSGLYRISSTNNKITMVPNTENYAFSGEPILFNNSIYIGHYGGVLQVPLSDTEQFHPKVYISKTTVSGQSYLQNKTINIESKSDVITLGLASLDYRSGQEKQYKYQINNGLWHKVNGKQLTLTGLASGEYHLTIQGTNSLGQWSDYQAFANINVAYAWYWTPYMRIIYAISLFSLICITGWLLYLRGRSISQIHQLLSADLKTRGMAALNVSRNLTHAAELYDELTTNQPETSNDISKSIGDSTNQDTNKNNQELIKSILVDSINELTKQSKSNEPNALYGKNLWVALPYFTDYLHKKYHVKVALQIDITEGEINYEMQSDIYKIIYEAIISAVLNDTGRQFNVLIQIFKQKLWLTIGDDRNSFNHFTNKISFDMAMYYIRQIAHKYNASINTFDEQKKGSQLVISFPLMKLS